MLARTVHEDLDVDLREPSDARGLLGRKFLGEAQPEHLEFPAGQHAARTRPDILGAVALLQLAGGRRLMACELGGNELPFSDRSKVVQSRAAGNRQQPVDNRPIAIDAVYVPEGLDER